MQFLVQQQPAYVYTGTRPLNPTLPSIVFIHGAANDHSVWTLQARYFAHHGWNALAVDLPGHGKSFADAMSTVADYADWIINLLDNGGISSAVLVGHSMGSLIALDCARRHAGRVSKLALLGCSVPMPVSDALMDAARNRPTEAFDMINIWGHATRLKWGKNPTPGTSSMMAYRRLLEQSRPGVLARDLSACAQFSLDATEIATITAATLIVAGSEDMMTPVKSGKQLAAQLPDACIAVIEGSGHALMQEAPGAVLDAVHNHLRTS